MLMLSWPACVAAALLAVCLDRWLGEPARWHPLVGFGRLAALVESRANGARAAQPGSALRRLPRRVTGLLAWTALVAAPAALLAGLLAALSGSVAFDAVPTAATATETVIAVVAFSLHVAVLYLALGARSLELHIAPIAFALAAGDLPAARALTARIVSRDTADADAPALARAACESALENGNDAIFGALFWFLVAGAPGALAYRLANTLDAMWGYRTPRLLAFGWAAARLDDLLNLVPARLTALSYALLGATRQSLRCWRRQASAWSSPNAGPVMAAGAGAVGVMLGGAASYHGEIEERPPLGAGRVPGAGDIAACLALVRRTLWLWLAIASCTALPALAGMFAAAQRFATAS